MKCVYAFMCVCPCPFQACADVRAGPVFWQQMEIRDQLTGESSFPEWLSTHPSHRNRFTQLDRLIPQVYTLTHSPYSWASKVWNSTPPVCCFGVTVKLLELLEGVLNELMMHLERCISTCRHVEEGREEGETWGRKGKMQGRQEKHFAAPGPTSLYNWFRTDTTVPHQQLTHLVPNSPISSGNEESTSRLKCSFNSKLLEYLYLMEERFKMYCSSEVNLDS